MADGILTPCNVERSWHWFRHVTAPCNMTCGSGLMTVNSPSGSTLQCDTWLWNDMPLNSPKRPPYWNSTFGLDFDHIIAVDMWFCTSLRSFIQIGPTSAEKNYVMSIFKMADLSHLGFKGALKFWKAQLQLTNLLNFPEIAFFAFWRQDPRWQISAILDFRCPVMRSLISPCTTS